MIAGYDQSGGAGVLADVKTLEAHGVDGFAVCTALTFQNERRISRVEWLSEAAIFEQIDLCFETVAIEWVKMGITKSMGSAAAIIGHLKRRRPDVRQAEESRGAFLSAFGPNQGPGVQDVTSDHAAPRRRGFGAAPAISRATSASSARASASVSLGMPRARR